MSAQKKKPGRGNFGKFLDDKGAAPAVPAEEPAASPPSPSREPVTVPGASAGGRRRQAKFPATYRMPERTLDLIDAAKDAAAREGQRLAKEDAVAHAVEVVYGHLIPTTDDPARPGSGR